MRVVKSSDTNENQVRSHLCFAEQRRPAGRTESAMHFVPAIRQACIVLRIARHGKPRRMEAGVHRSAAGTEILAFPAPAHPRYDRWLGAFPADRPTETLTSDRHSCAPRRKDALA